MRRALLQIQSRQSSIWKRQSTGGYYINKKREHSCVSPQLIILHQLGVMVSLQLYRDQVGTIMLKVKMVTNVLFKLQLASQKFSDGMSVFLMPDTGKR